MVMPRVKCTTFVVGIIGLGGIVIWQQSRLFMLDAQNASLREQVEQQAKALSAASHADKPRGSEISASVLSVPRESSRDLLRLRGEIGVLREQLAEAQRGAATVRKSQVLLSPEAESKFVELMASWAEKIDRQASDLAIPENVAKMDPAEGLRDKGLERYEKCFELKAQLEAMHGELEAARRTTASQTK
jgi:hypothetical protein